MLKKNNLSKVIFGLILTAAFATNVAYAEPRAIQNNKNAQLEVISSQTEGIEKLNETAEIQAQATDNPIGEMDSVSFTTTPRTNIIGENTVKSPYVQNNLDVQVVPKMNKEFFNVALMFCKVMIAVMISSFIIWGLLLIVKKFFGENIEEQVPKWGDEPDLRTPKNDSIALKNFLNQTKNH
ncbi:hypothetical protein IKA15_01170 [bacterium]|nr:hypothetical protein [bacterium]